MPAYPDPNSPRVRAFITRLAGLSDDDWRTVAARYDDESELAIAARILVSGTVRGEDLHITDPERADRVASAHEAERVLEAAVAHAVRSERARQATADALWAVLVADDLQGTRAWARRTLLDPFATMLPELVSDGA